MSPRRRQKSFLAKFSLDAQTQRGIATVFVFALALILLASLFDMAGSIGLSMDQALAHILGADRIFLPFVLITVGTFLFKPSWLALKWSNGVGFLMFFAGLNSMIHLLTFRGTAPTGFAVDAAGGKLGMMLAEPMVPLFGVAGGIIFYIAVFVVSLVLMFNTSLATIYDWLNAILVMVKKIAIIAMKPFMWGYGVIASLLKRKSVEQNEYVQKNTYDNHNEPEDEGNAVEDKDTKHEIPGNVQISANKAPNLLKEQSQPKPHKKRNKKEVPLDLLNRHDQKPTSGDIDARQSIIKRTLETFGVPVEMGEVAIGPTVTQFTFKPAEGVKLNRITALHNDMALALAAHPIRIEAPIPGKALVGLEVPNQSVAIVGLREMFETKDWKDRKGNVIFALGRDVSGKPWNTDIARMPHLLVAGATGSGKSVCLNTIIMSFLYSYGPDDLKLILVDPKRVEFTVYNGLPHLITPVITEMDKTINALKWAVREMSRRFDILSKFGARNIADYNLRSQDKLPYMVMIIDELADLMVNNKQEVESQVVRLAQMSRAVGIHLILATQRPSVDVITGLIKANIPARIAFSVASLMDSRTILDASGAEKLIGRGDMLFQTAEMNTPKRIQGVFIADDEINRVVEFIKSAYDPAEYDPNVVEKPEGTAFGGGRDGGNEGGDDPLVTDAKEEIIRAGKASASLLQRRLKVGYARAARLLDLLELEGFIGPADGAKPREILKADFTNQMDAPMQDYTPETLEEAANDILGEESIDKEFKVE